MWVELSLTYVFRSVGGRSKYGQSFLSCVSIYRYVAVGHCMGGAFSFLAAD